MLNPMRPEVEHILFPDEESVTRFFAGMDESLSVALDEAQALDVRNRNIEYLASCIQFFTIANSGVDLTKYQLSPIN